MNDRDKDTIVSILSVVTTAIAGAVSAPAGAVAAVGGILLDSYKGLYADLQTGKANMRTTGANWSDAQKREGNRVYKKVMPSLHRSGSTDVFPGI